MSGWTLGPPKHAASPFIGVDWGAGPPLVIARDPAHACYAVTCGPATVLVSDLALYELDSGPTALAASPVSKAAYSQATGILETAVFQGPRGLATLILTTLASAIPGVNITALAAALQAGNLNGAVAQLKWEDVVLPQLSSDVKRKLLEGMAGAAAKEQAALFGKLKAGATLKFDLLNPESIRWIQDRSADLVTAVDQAQRETLKLILGAAFVSGQDWRKVARAVRETVGLTPRLAKAVDNFRGRLVKKGVAAAKVDAMASKYAARLRAYRSRVIARTETIAAANRGQQEVWNQAIAQGLIDESVALKRWVVRDPCPICQALAGTTAPIKGTFPGGYYLPPDPHPQCKCGVVLLPRGKPTPKAPGPGPSPLSQVDTPPPVTVPVFPSPTVECASACHQVVDVDLWKQVGPQQGSQPGGLYEAPDGSLWYVKEAQSSDHQHNEVLARQLYALAGADVPEVQFARLKGKPAVASRWVNVQKLTPEQLAALPGTAENFGADAWLANWDVAGLEFDNLVVREGKAFRLDAGGALLYRAQGAPKGTAFGDAVPELATLRDPTKNPQAAAIFGKMTPAQVSASLARIEKLTPEAISAVVEAYAPADRVVMLKARLLARRDYLVQRRAEILAALAGPAGPPVPAVAPLAVKVPPSVSPAAPQVLAPTKPKKEVVTYQGPEGEGLLSPVVQGKAVGTFTAPSGHVVVYVSGQGHFVVPAHKPLSGLPKGSYVIKPGANIQKPTFGKPTGVLTQKLPAAVAAPPPPPPPAVPPPGQIKPGTTFVLDKPGEFAPGGYSAKPGNVVIFVPKHGYFEVPGTKPLTGMPKGSIVVKPGKKIKLPALGPPTLAPKPAAAAPVGPPPAGPPVPATSIGTAKQPLTAAFQPPPGHTLYYKYVAGTKHYATSAEGLPGSGWKLSKYNAMPDALAKLPTLHKVAGALPIPVAPSVPAYQAAKLVVNAKGETLALEGGVVKGEGGQVYLVKAGQKWGVKVNVPSASELSGISAGSAVAPPFAVEPDPPPGIGQGWVPGYGTKPFPGGVPEPKPGDWWNPTAQKWVHVNAKKQVAELDPKKVGAGIGSAASTYGTHKGLKERAPLPTSDSSLWATGHPDDAVGPEFTSEHLYRKAVDQYKAALADGEVQEWPSDLRAIRDEALGGWRGSPQNRDASLVREGAHVAFSIPGKNPRPTKGATEAEKQRYAEVARRLRADSAAVFRRMFGPDWRTKTWRLYRGVKNKITNANIVEGWSSRFSVGQTFSGHSLFEDDVPLDQILVWWGHPSWKRNNYSSEFEILRIRAETPTWRDLKEHPGEE